MEWFEPTQGLRQGDAISLYLFVLCMERLGHIIQAEVESGQWKQVKASPYGPKLSHLFFADDLILFVEASVDRIRVVMKCLQKLCSTPQDKKLITRNLTSFSLKELVRKWLRKSPGFLEFPQ